MGKFVDYDPSIFPYVFECADCEAELQVTHEEAERAAYAGLPVREAVKTVRLSKGWWVDPYEVKCPDCVVPLEERTNAARL